MGIPVQGCEQLRGEIRRFATEENYDCEGAEPKALF